MCAGTEVATESYFWKRSDTSSEAKDSIHFKAHLSAVT